MNYRAMRKNSLTAKLLGLSSLLISIIACNNKPAGKLLDTTTSGSITIAVDNTFEPIIRRELEMFKYEVPDGHINPLYLPESDVLKELYTDSVKVVFTTRKLNVPESARFTNKKIEIHQNMIARDAVALIVNSANTDSTFTMSDLRKVFTSEISTWQQHKKGSIHEDIQVVLDNNRSSTGRYIQEIAGTKALTGKNIYSLKKNTEVIAYVKTHKNAIGVIGVNWISEKADSVTNSFLANIRVVSLAPDLKEKGAGEYYKPYQAYIAQGFYPMTRDMYVISVETHPGLGTGFAYFINSDKGQRIILKSGIVPAQGIVRIVQFK